MNGCIVWLALFGLATVVRAATPNQLVQAELQANTSAIVPGVAFEVALRLTVAHGWHIYWTNPGDAGAATQFKLNLPSGWAAGPVKMPVPERLEQAGGLVVYAYVHEATILIDVTPPKDLAIGGKATLDGNASWCVCSDICVLGKKHMELALPIAKMAQPDNVEAFATYRRLLPHTPEEAFSSLKVESLSEDTGKILVTWRSPKPTKLIWIPGPSDEAVIKGAVVDSDAGSEISLKIAAIQGIPQTTQVISGILAYTEADGTRHGVAIAVDRKTLALQK